MDDMSSYFSYIPNEVTIEIIKLILDRKQAGILITVNKWFYSIVISLIDIFDNIKTSHDSLLKYFVNTTSLNLYNNKIITDKSVIGLTNLTSLNLYDNTLITDKSVMGLINLTSLNLDFNNLITDVVRNKLKNNGCKVIQ